MLKKSIILFGVFVVAMALLTLTTTSVHAAPVVKFPITVTQPDGTTLNLFVSGDEYYNWIHDEQGYTIIQHPVSGYYVYADLVNGKLVPTDFVAGKANPASVGLSPYLNISAEKKTQIRQEFLDQTMQAAGEIKNAPATGTINNLVVFIRFSGESEFTNPTSTYTDMLNSSTAGANSLRNYYREVSYNALTINSSLFPAPGSVVVSYQDSHTRNYFQPYNSVTNPGGYTGGDNGADRRVREHTLLKNAVDYVNSLGQFPGGASIDGDGDGYVDSLTFVISGSPTGWASLLWPHQWSLWSFPVTINGKRVYTYSFHLNSSLNNGVLAHEMFHVLGSPDLYHYSGNGIQPVGYWDVMEYDADPPQHMGCYMKFKYGHWISSIPEIFAHGTYTLNPLTSSTNNCKKIASPYSTTEFFVVEYRSGTGSTFESSLPGDGLIVYRINTLAYGNASGPPDEVYVYRPGGTTSVNGNIYSANFSSDVGRTAINDSTNPSSFLSNGDAGGLNICNVGSSGTTISFGICVADGYETDNTPGQAKWIYSGTPQTHSIVPAADEDWYKFQISASSAVLLETSGTTTSDDTYMYLYDNDGITEKEQSDDDGVGSYSFIDRLCGVDPLPAGIYYVRVKEYDGSYNIPSYNLSFSVSACPSTSVNAYIDGERRGSALLATRSSARQSYTGVNSGPMQVMSTDATSIIAATRILYGGVSYSEMMGFPANQLTNDYWFPYYNNVAMNSQLRVSNLGGSDTTITVTYGNGTPLDSYTLAAGATIRKNYAGINSGPLHVTSSTTNILTTIRVLYGGLSYSELMGFPNNQLARDYWYPYYNNVAMDSQLRVSNVGSSSTTITVTYGNNIPLDSYTLTAGAATRKDYLGINSGPLHVTSSASDILTTVRVIYGEQSYSEISGFPANQLTKKYTYPVYDNVTANSQLRVSNVGGVSTLITVYGANNVVIDSYTLAAGAATRKNYAGVNNGPLRVVSSLSNILTTQRLLYTTPGFGSFYELTGFPINQLTTEYYFPWYNNVAMSSQLRFAVP